MPLASPEPRAPGPKPHLDPSAKELQQLICPGHCKTNQYECNGNGNAAISRQYPMAFIIFQLVKMVNRMKKDTPAAPPAAPPQSEVYLKEIRDALAKR